MRVLVISPLFPPLADAEAICSGKFVEGLIDANVAPFVIFCSNVRTTIRYDGSGIWKSLQAVAIDIPSCPTSVMHRGWLGVRYQTTSWASWAHAVVVKATALHRQAPFDLIISRSLPQHAHLAAYWTAVTLRLPWFAHMNDPWDFSSFVSGAFSRRDWTPTLNERIWWRRVVARADGLSFPCERLRDFCLDGSRRQTGVFVVPHIAAARQPLRRPEEFRLVHAGKLGINELTSRSAASLLDGLAELFRIRPTARSLTRLLFVGPEDPETTQRAARNGLNGNVACTGLVNYEESLGYVAEASVCILVEGDFREGIFLPSKVCDYIGARKPILALSPEVGTVSDLSKNGGIVRVDPKDSMAVTNALVELFDAFMESRLGSYGPTESLVSRFESRTVIGNFLASVAESVSRPTRRGVIPAL